MVSNSINRKWAGGRWFMMLSNGQFWFMIFRYVMTINDRWWSIMWINRGYGSAIVSNKGLPRPPCFDALIESICCIYNMYTYACTYRCSHPQTCFNPAFVGMFFSAVLEFFVYWSIPTYTNHRRIWNHTSLIYRIVLYVMMSQDLHQEYVIDNCCTVPYNFRSWNTMLCDTTCYIVA